MSKSTKSAPAAITLAGKTAVELRGLLDTKAVAKAAVVAFLQAKEENHGLRAPATKLLAELTGAAPVAKAAPAKAAPAKAKPAAKVGKAEVAPAKAAKVAVPSEVAALVKRIAALEVEVAAMRAAAKPAAKVAEPVAKARKARKAV